MESANISFTRKEIVEILKKVVKEELGINKEIEITQIGDWEIEDFDKFDIYFKLNNLQRK